MGRMTTSVDMEHHSGARVSTEEKDTFLHIKGYYGDVMYNFVLKQVVDADLADEIITRAWQQLSLKRDLNKVLSVIEPWLAVFFHNFCQRELERGETAA